MDTERDYAPSTPRDMGLKGCGAEQPRDREIEGMRARVQQAEQGAQTKAYGRPNLEDRVIGSTYPGPSRPSLGEQLEKAAIYHGKEAEDHAGAAFRAQAKQRAAARAMAFTANNPDLVQLIDDLQTLGIIPGR